MAVRVVYDPVKVEARLCSASFERFVKHFWDCVPGAQPLRWNWHLKLMCDAVQRAGERAYRGEPLEHDLLFNVPPGSSKSSILTVMFTAWAWTGMPKFRHLVASHASDLVLDLSTKCRNLIESDEYRRHWPQVELADDQDTKGHYRNSEGGDRYSCTVGGRSPVGQHAHLITIDDPLDPKGARSALDVEAARHFMTDVIPGRKLDQGVTPTVLVMQRLGLGDPTDVMLEQAKKPDATPVKHYCLPAELTDDVSPPECRAEYEARDGLLDPGRLSRLVLKAVRARMTELAYQAQYNQRPTIPGGGMFRAPWFTQFVKAAPYVAKRVFAVDRAATQAGGCATAGTLLARTDEGRWYVEDVLHGHWEPDQRNDELLARCQAYRRRYGPRHEPTVLIEREGGSSDKEAFKAIARRLAGFRVREVRVSGSKDRRAEGWADALASMNVFIADNGRHDGTGECAWDVDGFIREHLAFKPDLTVKRLGGMKDRVDSCSLGYNWLVDKALTTSLPLRTYTFSDDRKKGKEVRFLAVDADELLSCHVIDPALLVCFHRPPNEKPEPYQHALDRVVGQLSLAFGDIDMAEIQETYGGPIQEYDGMTAAQAAVTQEQCRRLWGLLLRQYAAPPSLVAFASAEKDRIPLSVAYAVCDTLRYDRDRVILDGPAGAGPKHAGREPPNRYVYDMVRKAKTSS